MLKVRWVLFLFFFLPLTLPIFAHANPCKQCGSQSAVNVCQACKIPYYCDKDCQKKDWEKHKPICKSYRDYQELAGKTQIQESLLPNGGLGLFAAKNIALGEKVALYDGEFIETESPLSKSLRALALPYNNYVSRGLLEGRSPAHAPHLAGQFINDGVLKTLSKSDQPFSPEVISRLRGFPCGSTSASDFQFIEDFVLQYALIQLQRSRDATSENEANVEFHDQMAYATRDIEKGEEILQSYGATYWVSIATETCLRKGFPLTAARIRRSASQGAEEAQIRAQETFHLNYEARKFFESYATKQQHARLMHRLSSPFSKKTDLLSGLFANFELLVFSPKDGKEEALEKMWEVLEIDQKIRIIQDAPTENFMTKPFQWSPHPVSFQILDQILAYQKTEGEILVAISYNKKQRYTMKEAVEALKLAFIEVLPTREASTE